MRFTCAMALAAVATAAPAHADGVPRSLRMRVAQAAPDDLPVEPPVPPDTAEPPAPPPAPPPPAPPPAAPAEPPPAESGEEVIVVTGSNIEHDLVTGAAPVSVVTRTDLETSGRATLGDILQAQPAQANGANAQVNAGGDGATRLDLRGLGASRTLVLLNGRRFVPGGNGADASVDVDAIPLAMIERVEILKDGASALYGADAIGGVVNIITRKQFDGSEVALLSSTSQHGDGSELDASFVQGFTTDDRNLYFMVSGGYQRHGAVLASDRPFS
ncbi:MAG: TonB-dependent receptor plug domain-containing protein, partial [Acidobacteriota bacterium]